jgi:hypothetical protein
MDIVLVEWVDSRRGEGWTLIEDLRNDHSFTKCKSIGWVIAKDGSSLTLAAHIGENPDQCCGDMTIPAKSIIRITTIKQPRNLPSK